MLKKLSLFLLLQAGFISQLNATGSVNDLITLIQSMGTLLNQNAQLGQLDTAGNNAVSALNSLGANSPGITLSTCSQDDFNTFVTRLLSGFTMGIMHQINPQNSQPVKSSLKSVVPGFSKRAGNKSISWSPKDVTQKNPAKLATQVSVLSASLGALIEQLASPAYEYQVNQGLDALQALYNSKPSIAGDWTNTTIDNMTSEAYRQLGYDFVAGIVDAAVVLQDEKLNQQALTDAMHHSGVGPVIAKNVQRINQNVRSTAFEVVGTEISNLFTQTIGQNVKNFFTGTLEKGLNQFGNEAKQVAEEAAEKAKQVAEEVAEKAQQVAEEAAEKVKQEAEQAARAAQQAAEQVAERVKQAEEQAARAAQQAAEQAAERVQQAEIWAQQRAEQVAAEAQQAAREAQNVGNQIVGGLRSAGSQIGSFFSRF